MINQRISAILFVSLLSAGCSDSNTDTQSPGTSGEEPIPVSLAPESEINGSVVKTFDTFDSLGVLSFQSTYEVNADNSTISQFEVNEDGSRTELVRFYFDGNGLLTQRDQFSPISEFVQTQTLGRRSDGMLLRLENATQAGTEIIDFTYDGNQIVTRSAVIEGEDNVVVATYNYGQDGKLISLLEVDDLNALEESSTFTYNEEGVRISKESDLDNDGVVDNIESYMYDELGNVIEISLTDESGALISRDIFTYEVVDQLKTNLINFSRLYFP